MVAWLVKRCAVAAVVFGTVVSAEASFLKYIPFFRNWTGKARPEVLMVTGNYVKSRLLAELAQYKTRQPILLVSPTAAGGVSEMFFMPYGPDAMALDAGQYLEFVDFLQPRKIVFLGDADYLPQAFVNQLRDRYPSVMISGADWKNNATMLGGLLKYKKLARDYDAYLLQVEETSWRRPAGMTPLTGGAVPPEPRLQPVR